MWSTKCIQSTKWSFFYDWISKGFFSVIASWKERVACVLFDHRDAKWSPVINEINRVRHERPPWGSTMKKVLLFRLTPPCKWERRKGISIWEPLEFRRGASLTVHRWIPCTTSSLKIQGNWSYNHDLLKKYWYDKIKLIWIKKNWFEWF